MGTVAGRLIDALKGELSCLEELLDCAERKAEAVIRDDVVGLLSVLERECSITERARVMESERRRAAAELAGCLSLAVPNPALREIARMLPEEESALLENLRRDILSCAERLRAANSRNAALVAQALEFANFNLRLLGVGAGGAGYDRDGGCTEASPSVVVDQVS